jgi:hypothetical protein
MTDKLREREQSHEAHFKLSQELMFKARCRRNKLFGLWAARRLGKTGGDAEQYARELVRADFDHPAKGQVLGRVLGDFRAAEIDMTEAEIAAALARFDWEAAQQIAGEYPEPLDRDHVQIGG